MSEKVKHIKKKIGTAHKTPYEISRLSPSPSTVSILKKSPKHNKKRSELPPMSTRVSMLPAVKGTSDPHNIIEHSLLGAIPKNQ